MLTVSSYILQSVPTMHFLYYSCVFFFLSSVLHPSPTFLIDVVLCTQTEIGVVYNPIMEELYMARAGQGAFCNGTKLQVTNLEGMLNHSAEYQTELCNAR